MFCNNLRVTPSPRHLTQSHPCFFWRHVKWPDVHPSVHVVPPRPAVTLWPSWVPHVCTQPAFALFMRRHRRNLPATLRLYPALWRILLMAQHMFSWEHRRLVVLLSDLPVICCRIVSGWRDFVHFPPTCYCGTGLDLSLTDAFNAARTPTVFCGIKAKKKREKSYYLCFELYQQPTSSDITNFAALRDDPFISISTPLWKGTLKKHIIITLHSMEETNCCILLWTLKCKCSCSQDLCRATSTNSILPRPHCAQPWCPHSFLYFFLNSPQFHALFLYLIQTFF